jgi:phosphate transport system substrate-binding protein
MLLVSLALGAGACARAGDTSLDRADRVVTAPGVDDRATLIGAGSTFAAPILQEWISQYRRVAPDVAIDYRAGGSVTGIERLASGSVDFALSELSLADVLAGATETRSPAVEVPCLAGGVAIAYDLPDVSRLQLSPTTLAAIFSGQITRWDDPSISADNGDRSLPPRDIQVVRRSDASGTTQVFTQFLRAAAPDRWALGAGPTVTWPPSTGAEGSDALIAAVEHTVGAIGYAAANYPMQAGVGTAFIGNGAGRFVAPTPDGVNAAVSRANVEAPGAYPIATVTFLVFSPSGPDEAKSAALRHFVTWVLTEGQRSAERLAYAPMPEHLRAKALTTVLATGQGREQRPIGAGP